MAKQLDPEIRRWADKIYASDKIKFSRLWKWINAASRSYSAPTIARTLERFVRHPRETRYWWGYLDNILDKEEGKDHARHAERASEEHKAKTREASESLFGRVGVELPKGRRPR